MPRRSGSTRRGDGSGRTLPESTPCRRTSPATGPTCSWCSVTRGMSRRIRSAGWTTCAYFGRDPRIARELRRYRWPRRWASTASTCVPPLPTRRDSCPGPGPAIRRSSGRVTGGWALMADRPFLLQSVIFLVLALLACLLELRAGHGRPRTDSAGSLGGEQSGCPERRDRAGRRRMTAVESQYQTCHPGPARARRPAATVGWHQREVDVPPLRTSRHPGSRFHTWMYSLNSFSP